MNTLNKKVLAGVLVLLILVVTNMAVFANGSRKKIDDMKNIVQSIANGSDTMVGGGVQFDKITEPGEISPQWSSGGINHTHQFLAARGITIIENDKGWSTAQHLYENDGTNIILEYADMPDTDETDTLTFSGHFYNYYTHLNYLGQSSPTAKTRFTSHMANAVNNFSSNKTYAWQELGRAIHFISDANEPHHASNMIAVITNHAPFEQWADTNRVTYGITSSSKYNDYNSDTFAVYVNKILDASAQNGYAYKDNASSSNTSLWGSAAGPSLGYAQQEIAALLYRFLKAVGEI
ncbi:MAG: phospholipase [Ruminiclostridium sp.]|nr:phospholipase [Ruminiclostridium sp.]